jgi:proteasome lid subunit RPN8/RPN11
MLEIAPDLVEKIQNNGEKAYPEEGAGFLIGVDGEVRRVLSLLALPNARESAARHNRYILTPQDYLSGEEEADRLKLILLGVFHSHPDHPNQPSNYDREWAQPFFSYVITSVEAGKAGASRSWRLLEDRSAFLEEPVRIGISISTFQKGK